MKHKVEIDTSELLPHEILRAFFDVARVHLSHHDLLRMNTEALDASTMAPRL